MTDGNKQSSKRILAVDGGGSKTIAWMANVVPSSSCQKFELEVIGRGQAGPSNPRSVGFETAFANLDAAIKMAGRQVSSDPEIVDVACLSLAGAGRADEQNQIRDWAVANRIGGKIIVIDDVEPLRFAAMQEQSRLPDFDGISWDQSVTLVVGTGSIACGRNGKGRSVRAGGWGYLLGDEGSGFSIGLAGLRAICQARDRGKALTDFQTALLHRIGLSAPTELVGFVYQPSLPRAQVAELSEVVIEHAEKDPIAEQILANSISDLTELVANVARRLELVNRSYSLALSGGIVSNHSVVSARLIHKLEQIQLSPMAYHVVREPIYGALTLAMNL